MFYLNPICIGYNNLMEPKFENPTLLEIDHRVVIQNAKRTIKSLESVLVELITNSDDAYKRESTQGGEIGVYLKLGKGREVKEVSVWDAAGGIEDLEVVLKYGGRHSSTGGETIPKRGYHGRGLKEAIIALGTGWIRTVHKGIPSEVQVNVEKRQVLIRKAMPPIDTSKWRITGDGT
ncbi:MAG: ATP-binding protein [Fimbriimonadales bacterium]|nr:ATP-binding protein [Fimbriimonadales bacterium]